MFVPGRKRASAECDALHYGMDWLPRDWSKPQIMIETTFGDSHPGSSHLDELGRQVEKGVWESGGRPARYTVTDVCDGVCQGTAGMSYSLLMRDFMAAMIEIQAVTRPVDGLVFISGCDKCVPAHLMAAARLKLPAVFLPGGTMAAGAHFLCTDCLWESERQCDQAAISEDELLAQQLFTCPSAGACQGMGTATTMQILTEALGLALTDSAIIPVTNNAIKRAARDAGLAIDQLVRDGVGLPDILTRQAIENAIVVHASILGSANAILHLIAMAGEMGISCDMELFDRIHRQVPVLTNVQPIGQYPAEWLWYAGGVPAVMLELRDYLHLDALTVTGHTLGENLEQWEGNTQLRRWKLGFLHNHGLQPEQVIKTKSNPLHEHGSIAILKGNLCPGGAVIKHAALGPDMQVHTGAARVFDREDDALAAVAKNMIRPGEIIMIRYQGAQAAGMPEMFRISDAIACKPELAETTAVITDGRYSGYTRAPAIGYLSPEAYDGGTFALVETGDLITIDIPRRRLDLSGIAGQLRSSEEIEPVLSQRRGAWQRPELPVPNGALSIYRRLVNQPHEGARML